jgi:hypothetical protein
VLLGTHWKFKKLIENLGTWWEQKNLKILSSNPFPLPPWKRNESSWEYVQLGCMQIKFFLVLLNFWKNLIIQQFVAKMIKILWYVIERHEGYTLTIPKWCFAFIHRSHLYKCNTKTTFQKLQSAISITHIGLEERAWQCLTISSPKPNLKTTITIYLVSLRHLAFAFEIHQDGALTYL